MLGLAPFIRNYRWTPERGLRIHVFDKDSGALVASRTTGPLFAFHHINAYDEGGNVVIDVATYSDSSIIDQLYLSRLRAGLPVDATGSLTRLTVPIDGADEVGVATLSAAMLELPRIDYDRCAGKPYRYVWGTGRQTGADFLDSIVRIDVRSGKAQTWTADGCFPGEPVFVAAPDAQQEGEGVLLSVVLDARRTTSFLLVLDATTLAEIARADCPHHIPFSFHGNYFPGG
jgi:carotenoid cleavage dioxygenase-like enzyme